MSICKSTEIQIGKYYFIELCITFYTVLKYTMPQINEY